MFAWRGDIWRAPVAGGGATRLTIHEAQDTQAEGVPRRQVDRSSAPSARGNYDVFVMPIDGGEPKQVTCHSGADIGTDWSPGRQAHPLPLGPRRRSPTASTCTRSPSTGGTPRRITRDGGRDGAYSPDGKSVVYARGFKTINQDDYKGSANYDLFVVDLDGRRCRASSPRPR